jgi:hypothetical protein
MVAMYLGLVSIAMFGAHIYDLHRQRTISVVRSYNGRAKIDEHQSRTARAASRS